MRIRSSLVAVVVVLAGCGSDGLPGAQQDGSASVDLMVSLDFAQVAPDLSVARDLAVVRDLAPPADFSGVNCGNMTCAQGQVCCASVQNQMLVQSCEASCNSDGGAIPLLCDGPEDCMNNFCCVDVKFNLGGMVMTSGTGCKPACTPALNLGNLSATTRLCHNDGDCDPKAGGFGAKCCSVPGQPAHFCAAPFAMFGITCP